MASNSLCIIFLTTFCIYTTVSRKIYLENEKIVNGYDASMEDFYYQASLRYRGEHFCGGSIINDHFILTAGHCIRPFQDRIKSLRVHVGTADIYEQGGQQFSVLRANVHPYFNEKTLNNDAALVELDGVLEFTKLARPIRLGNRKSFPENAVGVISGWGYKSENDDELSEHLQAARVPIISLNNCREFYKKLLTDTMICAGYISGEKDACQGDSGGPLVYERQLIGIVSWGMGCARPKRPGVYTNVYTVLNFITNVTGIV